MFVNPGIFQNGLHKYKESAKKKVCLLPIEESRQKLTENFLKEIVSQKINDVNSKGIVFLFD